MGYLAYLKAVIEDVTCDVICRKIEFDKTPEVEDFHITQAFGEITYEKKLEIIFQVQILR